MSLTNASIVTAPSGIAATGGSALAFASMGQAGSNSLLLAASADTDLRLRRTIQVTAKLPAVSVAAPNGYTQARSTMVFKKPKLLANGKITINTVRVEVAYDVESSAAEVQELIDVGAQLLCDSDFTPTHKTLALT